MVHKFLKKNIVEVILILFVLAFSFWLMFSTFSFKDGTMYIASKAWSDFGSHIPLIRSFSFGDNIPPQYPLFPGEPIRYHFLFYAFVGFLERLGMRIDYALNIPSAFSFAALLGIIYIFGKTLFRNKAVGVLAVAFFIFNGSLSFLEFFKEHPVSIHTVRDVFTNTAFPSFAPYGKGIVTAFWNLNIYTNQRHLAGAYGLSLFLLLFLLRLSGDRKQWFIKSVFIGVTLGLSFFFHMAVFLMTIVIIAGLFILFPKLRPVALSTLFVAGMIALPQYLTMRGGSQLFSLAIHPGYLVANTLTVSNFIQHWFFNLGLHLILMPLGFLVAPKNIKKLLLCFLPVFLIGNLVQFSVEIAANHKFFNYFMLVGVMFSAYFLVYLWKRNLRPLVIVLLFFLTLSGFIDFFPIYNDSKLTLLDYPKNADVAWIMHNTPKESIFLNSSYLYHPASLAGRKIFLGWPYFAWSQGYDTLKRDILRKKLLSGDDITSFCQEVKKYDLSFVVTEQIDRSEDYVINRAFFAHHFSKVFENKERDFVIYATKQGC